MGQEKSRLSTTSDNPIILFDGYCVFCSATARFILKRDKTGRLRYAAIQSEPGKNIIEKFNLDNADLDTIIFIHNEIASIKSDAVIKISKYLRFPWNLISSIKIIPVSLRDYAYDIFARNRYRWFGKRNTCFIPTEEEKKRFLD